jgi:hypothetical protein
VKVLFIAGCGRSGSTVLGQLLGELDGFVHIGEIRYVWDLGVLNNAPCGCGEPFRRCSWWRKIFLDGFDGLDRARAEDMVRLRQEANRTRHLLRMMSPFGDHQQAELGELIQNTRRLYRSLEAAHPGVRVVVDSSKSPSYLALLRMALGSSVHVVHLVRDPRAVSHSWRRRRHNPDTGGDMPRLGLARSALLWTAWNLAVPWAAGGKNARYRRLHYEDFVSRPQHHVRELAAFVDEKSPKDSFLSEHVARIGTQHTLSGNPMRFDRGVLDILPDREWAHAMTRSDRSVVLALTWPLLIRYGYELPRS